jgi:hypothetical protein
MNAKRTVSRSLSPPLPSCPLLFSPSILLFLHNFASMSHTLAKDHKYKDKNKQIGNNNNKRDI